MDAFAISGMQAPLTVTTNLPTLGQETSIGQIQVAKRPRVYVESSKGQIIQGTKHLGCKTSRGEMTTE